MWPARRTSIVACSLLLSLASPAMSAGSPLEEWDQAELKLRQGVWRLYAATAAFGKDARNRTVEDDLNAWVMSPEVRSQLKTARAQAEHQLQTGDATGARATWSSAKEILDEQSRRFAVVGLYWEQQRVLERQRALWLRWLNEVPDKAAGGSRGRIDELTNTLTTDFAPTIGYGALTKDITALEEGYDKERQQLARQVSERRVAAGEKLASRDRTLPCPQRSATADERGTGDRAPKLLSSPSAEQYYPSEARAELITGDVILAVTVGVDGCMRHAEVTRSSGAPELDDAALDLIEWATFGPASAAGKLIESTSQVKYHFTLADDAERPGHAAPDWLASKEDVQLAAALKDGFNALSNGEKDKAAAIVARIRDSSDFDALTPQLRLGFWRLATWLAFDAKDGARALEMSKHATELDLADAEDWQRRLRVALVAKDQADATASLTTMARRWPASLQGLPDGIAAQVVRETPKSAGGGRYELLEALYDAGYTANGLPPSGWWRDLALLHLERGERAPAITILSHIDDPHVAIGIRADRRFDSIKSDIQDQLDVAAMAQRAVDLRRDVVLHNPDKLESVLQLIYELVYTERYAEVLRLCDEVDRQAADGSGPKAYTDWAKKYVWILDNRSRALFALGRWDEALAQELAATKPGLGDQVSQIINLAGLYNELARPKEARDALATVDSAKLSAYGRTQVANELLRSADQLGDSVEVERQLQYLREHKSDSFSTLNFALISAGREDEAAEVLITRLRDPDQRLAALVDVQDYHHGALPPREAEFWQRWKSLIARPDVHAEIDKVGNVGSYPIRRRAL